MFRKQFCSVISGLKIIGHGNPDNNLESHCTFMGIQHGSEQCPLFEVSMHVNITTRDNDHAWTLQILAS
jgi:hypothetical protein